MYGVYMADGKRDRQLQIYCTYHAAQEYMLSKVVDIADRYGTSWDEFGDDSGVIVEDPQTGEPALTFYIERLSDDEEFLWGTLSELGEGAL